MTCQSSSWAATTRSAVYAFLECAGDGPTALVLEGEAGIGKTTLWRRGVELAAEHGLRTLTARPAEAERMHAHAALADLLDDALDEVVAELPSPRRHALRVALLLEDPDDVAASPRAVGVATRSALEALVRTRPLLIAIDDEQWLDASSASALMFAVRRLTDPVRLLLTRRAGIAARIEDVLPDDRVERLTVGALSLGAIQQLLHERLGVSFSRLALHRLHETAGGNPFYALELARTLDPDDARANPTAPLPVPERLEELVRSRLERFAGRTREALILASAHARLTLGQLAAASIDRDALDPAVRENVIQLSGGAVRFAHPLLASALYHDLGPGERQRVHARLAELVDDPLERAHHLALATAGPAAEIAATLEQAANAANARGAPIAAAELAEQAVRLTPADASADAERRLEAAARANFDAGEVERARALARDLLARTTPGPLRGQALVVAADLERENLQRRVPLLREALCEVAGGSMLEASIHRQLALALRFTDGYAAAEDHASAAVEVAKRLDDHALVAAALGALAIIRFNRGRPDALRLAEQAVERARLAVGPRARLEAEFGLVHVLVWSRHAEQARGMLAALQQEWADRSEYVIATVAWYRALVELHSGRLMLAADLAEQSRELSLQYANEESESPQSLFVMALAAAHRGALDDARQLAERSLHLSVAGDTLLSGPLAALGLVELWSGDAAAAVLRFAAADETAAATAQGEPAACWWCDEQVEALLELGRLDEAVAVLDRWEANARRLRRTWVIAHATRCRGLVAAAGGDARAAEGLLVEAADLHERIGEPFGEARALLSLGVVRRRARQKRAAREAIEAAVAAFERMGAAGWAGKARAQLGRIGGRTRVGGLTPAERRVARLVAEGRTNKEVATALFLAERTVETHLTHIYAKLGVRSRAQLARTLR